MNDSEPDLRGEVEDLKRRLATAEAKHAAALEELRVSREGMAQWEEILLQADVPIAIHEGPDHIFRFINERYEQITGVRQCVGLSKRVSFPELENQGVFESFDEVYRTGKKVKLPLLRFRSNKAKELPEAFFSQVLQPWRKADGAIAGVMSISHDVTEQARAREKAEQSLRLFQATGENIPYGVWWCGPDGGFVYVSPSFLEFTGKAMAEVSGDQWQELLPPDELGPTRQAWRQCLKRKENWEHEHQIRGRDGTYRTVLSLGRPILADNGELLAYAGLNLDITDRKQAEQELQRAKEAADAANKAKGTFLANMSHDIRTPLTAIIGYSEVLASRVEGQDEEIVRQIHNACTHLQTILDSILKYARLDSGAAKLETSPELLAPHVHKTCGMLQPHAEEHGVKLSIEIDEPALRADIDIGALNRILGNLIDNAVKYSKRGQSVTVALFRAEKSACIAVRDSGIGMSENFKEQLFQPFAQEREKQPQEASGAGLGMAITRQLVNLMDGRIEVDSSEGEGSEFRIYLPLYDSSEGNGISPKTGRSSAKPRDSAKPGAPRILVCEDAANTRQVLKYMLVDYSVDFATAEKELYKTFNKHDLVLLDINIGGRNIGVEMLGRLREMDGGREARVVAFTAHSLPGQLEEFLAAGFDDYLAKPFTRKELLQVINNATEAR